MAQLQFNAGERLIGHGMMAYQEPRGMFYRSWQGNIFITNQRAVFRMSMTGISMMELSLSEIRGFMVNKSLFVTVVTICSCSGEEFRFTGFPAKKLQEWLKAAGVPRL